MLAIWMLFQFSLDELLSFNPSMLGVIDPLFAMLRP